MVGTRQRLVCGPQGTTMVWIIIALSVLLGLIAFVVNEIRTAPDVEDDYEIRLRDFYRAKTEKQRRAMSDIRTVDDGDAA